MWNLKNDTEEPIDETNRLTAIENELVVAEGEGVGGGMEWEVGVSRHKLLHLKVINKIPLYGTEKYIHCLMTNHNGKEYFLAFPSWCSRNESN